MKISERVNLAPMNSFGVAARAALVATLESEEDILELPGIDPSRDYLLGGGSNVLFLDDVPGVLYLVRIPGKSIIDSSGDEVLVDVGAGENWHDLVLWSLDQGLNGLENLSLIPGLAGAAPFQNIGAYGVELSDVLESVTAWDWRRCQWRELAAASCGLGYRASRFKGADRGRFLITSIRLRLNRTFRPRLEYAGLRRQLDRIPGSEINARSVSEAVIALRRSKLPDWRREPNAGSFFKNPVIDTFRLEDLRHRIPNLVHWPTDKDHHKIPAARLIEASGLKGHAMGRVAVSGRHALVLVNREQASGREVMALANHVRQAVKEDWGVELEPEIQIVEFSKEHVA